MGPSAAAPLPARKNCRFLHACACLVFAAVVPSPDQAALDSDVTQVSVCSVVPWPLLFHSLSCQARAPLSRQGAQMASVHSRPADILRGVAPAFPPPRSPSPWRLDFWGNSGLSPAASPALAPSTPSPPASGISPVSSSSHSFVVVPPGVGPAAPDPVPMDLQGLDCISVPAFPFAPALLDLSRGLIARPCRSRASVPRPLPSSPLAAPPLPMRSPAPVYPCGPSLLSAPAPALLPRRCSGPPAHSSSNSPKVNAFGDVARTAPFVHCGFFPVSNSAAEASSMASEAGRALAHFRGMFCDFVAELGDSSTLFLHTKAIPNPRELRTRAVAKNAPSTLQLYLRSWSGWVSHSARSGFDPADPPPGSVPQWLQLTSAPSGRRDLL